MRTCSAPSARIPITRSTSRRPARRQLVALARHPKCVAFGEAGLDYHYNHAPKDTAARVFRNHIAAARDGRTAAGHSHPRRRRRIARKFCARKWGRGRSPPCSIALRPRRRSPTRRVELGLYISFSGVVTFKNSQSSARRRPPACRWSACWSRPTRRFWRPTPHRGKRNEPAFVAETARVLAELKGLSRGRTSPPPRPPMRCGCSPKCRRCAKRNAPRDAQRHDSRL